MSYSIPIINLQKDYPENQDEDLPMQPLKVPGESFPPEEIEVEEEIEGGVLIESKRTTDLFNNINTTKRFSFYFKSKKHYTAEFGILTLAILINIVIIASYLY